MVSGRLERISKLVRQMEIERAPWDRTAFDRINAELRGLLDELDKQIEQWRWEMDARSELQARLLGGPPSTERIRGLWWREQQAFYESLAHRIDHYLRYDEEATVTFSLTALELLLLVRLLTEEDVIKTATLGPVFRYLSRYGRTERQANLSFESLKKRYSTYHPAARTNVRNVLLKLIKRIDLYDQQT